MPSAHYKLMSTRARDKAVAGATALQGGLRPQSAYCLLPSVGCHASGLGPEIGR